MYFTYAYKRDYSHYQKKTDKKIKNDFLLCLDFDSSKDDDENADNFNDNLAS